VFLIFEGKRFFSAMPPLEAYYPVIGLAVFCTCGAFLLFTYSIRKIGLNNANIFSNMIPVFTVILAYLFIQEAVSVRKVMGILIVVSGLFLSQLPALRQRRLS
jgi:drug/metabolite transporter (DMT)-like permease